MVWFDGAVMVAEGRRERSRLEVEALVQVQVYAPS